MKFRPQSGSSRFDPESQFTGRESPIHLPGQFSPVSDHRLSNFDAMELANDADELVEYLHEVDVCAEEDFWWDEEDRYEL